MATQAINDTQEESMAGGLIAALPMIVLERKWLLIAPVVVTTLAGTLAAYMMHPVYESNATLLIESQQIPVGMIGQGQGMGDVIGERVARARERVLSRMDLIRLIRSYDLYPEQLRKMPLSKVVDLMRDSATIAAGNASLALGPQRGGADAISVTVSFDYDDPVKAQIVTQQFVNRLLDLDAAAQASQAQDTVNFLSEQANRLQAQIADVNGQMQKIKSANGTVLALGQTTGDPTADLSRIDSDIAGLQAEDARLALMPSQTEDAGGVAAAEAALRVAQAKFSDSHPDVLAAKAQVAAARAAQAAAPKGGSVVAAQLASNRAQLASLQRARAMIASHSSEAQMAQARAPALQGQVDQLERQSTSLHAQMDTIGSRLQAAQIQARVENEQKGERLTLADPPVVPDHPVKPNRPVLILGSLVGGAAFGLALILLIELVMRPIRGTAALREAIGQPPLAIIPDFDQKPGRIMRLIEKRVRRKTVRA